ncbi:MAG: hypothetical protein KatS3mg114_1445 [Planctomycetaceae bacterium]|nr:MAG: hypothetical protein KatS3mg114_1445 [Planctomycetaceae bacterium]
MINWLVGLFLAESVLLMGLGYPLFRGWIPPNRWYGVRLPATLKDPTLWDRVNRVAGGWLLATGLVQMVLALGGWLLIPLSVAAYAGSVGAVVGGMLLGCVVHSSLVIWHAPADYQPQPAHDTEQHSPFPHAARLRQPPR